jgi:hypothetical protein
VPVPKGTRVGGRQKGSLNKRTVKQMEEASTQVGAIRRQGQKKATEVLNDLMQTSMGLAAQYQRRIVDAAAKSQEPSKDDLVTFWKAIESTGVFAKALAPFQDPTFKAITVSMSPPDPVQPGQPAATIYDITDAVVVSRLYAKMVRRIT